jgi:TrmH family RNA methyltransferase
VRPPERESHRRTPGGATGGAFFSAVITSADNDKLKTIRKLQDKSWRERLDLFAAEGEDLVEAAEAAGWEPEIFLVAGDDVEPELLDEVSSLGSGTRVVGVYKRRWSAPGGRLSVYLHGVGDPGNVGAVIRSAHALADGPVVLGPGCADPFSPKAVRASMGSVFARPPARASFEELPGTLVGLDAHAELGLDEVEAQPPLVICLGAEREGLPEGLAASARIPLRPDGPESLNVAMAATVALYDLGNRMAPHG